MAGHSACAYQALFSPHQPLVLASCSTDGTLKIFDLRQPTAPSIPTKLAPNQTLPPDQLTRPALVVPAHSGEVLSIDWNKYRPFTLASGGVDKIVRVWDCRMVKLGPDAAQAPGVGGVCESQLVGHEWAVRKVQWCPHRADLLASASYDMTCRV